MVEFVDATTIRILYDRTEEEEFVSFEPALKAVSYTHLAENFPIADTRNNFVLEFLDYYIDPPRYTIDECIDVYKRQERNYSKGTVEYYRADILELQRFGEEMLGDLTPSDVDAELVRNSSAVEHFTRNEGVPSSSLGFGSESQRLTEM